MVPGGRDPGARNPGAEHPGHRGPGAFQRPPGGDRRADRAEHRLPQPRRSPGGRPHDRAAADAAHRFRAGRQGERHRRHGGGTRSRAHQYLRGPRYEAGAGARRGVPPRLEGNRVRGGARPGEQLHHRLQHGKHGSDGDPHRRIPGGGAVADAERRGVPTPPHGLDQDDPAPRHRGRMQRAVRAEPDGSRLPGHRGERPALPLVGARQQGDRVSARLRGGETGARVHPARPEERHHRRHESVLRAGARLPGAQGAPLGPRQVPGGRHPHRQRDEERRGGDGHRPHLPGSAPEGAPHAGHRRAGTRFTGPSSSRTGTTS